MGLGTWITAHKGDPTRATFWLVKLDLPTPVYLTDCDQPIFYDSHTFTPDPLSVDGVQSNGTTSGGSGGRLKLATGGSYWPALIAAVTSGTRTFLVTFWEAWLDVANYPSAVPAAVRTVAVMRVEAGEWTQSEIVFSLGPSADPALHRTPAREYSALCPYPTTGRFKGPLCGYSGSATTCDGTTTNCNSLSNLARYGGFGTFLAASQRVDFDWTVEDVPYTATVYLTRREK